MIRDLVMGAYQSATPPSGPTVEYLGFYSDTVDGTTWTFSGVNFGAAGADRLIVAQVMCRTSGASLAASSVTIGGIPATLIQNTSAQSFTALAVAAVPAGTSGDVVVTMAGNCVNCSIGVNAIRGAASATPTSSNRAIAGSQSTISVQLTNQGGEAVIAAVSATTSMTVDSWTGVTESFDTTVESALRAGALATNAAAGSYTVGATTPVTGNLVIAAAGWK